MIFACYCLPCGISTVFPEYIGQCCPLLPYCNIGDDLSDIFCIIGEKDLPRFEAMGTAGGELSTIEPLSSTRHLLIGRFR